MKFSSLKIRAIQTVLNNLFQKSAKEKKLFSIRIVLFFDEIRRLFAQNSIKDISNIQNTERHDGHGQVDSNHVSGLV